MTRLGTVLCRLIGVGCVALVAGCAVGPGTPLLDAMKTNPGQGSADVPAPKGYGPPADLVEPSGLIDPREREATQTYLENLAGE